MQPILRSTGRFLVGENVGRIVDKNGLDTGFCVCGTLCPQVISLSGVKTGYHLAGTIVPTIVKADGNQTGFIISGQLRREFMGPQKILPWEKSRGKRRGIRGARLNAERGT